MFCTKCGSQLDDGAKFCTNCGAQTRFAPVPPPAAAPAEPAAPAPAAPQPQQWQAPQQPQQPAQPQWQQPAQPQWQQPTQPAQPQQPTQPTQQPQWQAQQPQQWQQIQQQWQQRQAPQQPAQPAQPQWQQPNQPQQWQQPLARGGAAPAQPAKKKGKGGLIAAIAAVLAVVVGVGGFVWPGFLKGGKGVADAGGAISTALAEKFSTPEEFYQIVESENVDTLAAHVSSVYDTFVHSNVTSDDISISGSLRIEPGDKLRELLLDLAGERLEELNPGEDLKWLKSLALTYSISRKNDLSGLNGSIQLNGVDLATVSAMMRSEDGTLWLSVPELSDKWLQTTLEDLGLEDNELSGPLGSVLSLFSQENAEKLDPLTGALPDDRLVGSVLEKYLSEAVDCIEDVEKDSGTLSTEGVSADYTVLTSTITPDTVVAIVEKLGPELKADKDIKKTILDIAAAAGEEGETKYKEFTDRIDELLEDPSQITEDMTDNIVMTVYLDKSGDVHGRVIEAGEHRIELLMPEKDGQFGLTLRYTNAGEERFSLSGGGKRSGDKLTGELDLTVQDEYYAVVALDALDVEKIKDGFLVGGVELRPTASLWEKVDEDGALPESVRSLLESLVLRLDMNTSKDKAEISLSVTNGSEKFITIAVDGAKSGAKKLSPVDGAEPGDWADDITLDRLEKVVSSIEKAGAPTAYTDLLDDLLDSAFDG